MCKQKRYPTNPIGVIALFISFCYGAATIVIGTNIDNFSGANERQPLIWFVIVFPLIVLGVFVYLVVEHHTKLYAPGDFRSDAGFWRPLTEKEKRKKEKETEKKQKTLQTMEIKEDLQNKTSQDCNHSLNVDIVESLIVRKLSRDYGRQFSDNDTAFVGKNGNRMVFDAVSIDSQYFIAVEIKYCPSKISINQFVDRVRPFLNQARKEVSDRLMIILAIFTDWNDAEALEKLKSKIKIEFPQITTIIYTKKDLIEL